MPEGDSYTDYIVPGMLEHARNMPGDAHCDIPDILPVLCDKRAVKIGEGFDMGGSGEVTYYIGYEDYLFEDGTVGSCTVYDYDSGGYVIRRPAENDDGYVVPNELEQLYPEEYMFLD